MLKVPLELIERFFTIINLKEIDKILSIITLQEDKSIWCLSCRRERVYELL
jgi:hypothetical protein